MNLSYKFKKKLILVLNCWKISCTYLELKIKIEIKLKFNLIYLNVYIITIKIVCIIIFEKYDFLKIDLVMDNAP